MSIKFVEPIKEILNFGQNGVHVFFLISGFIIVYSLNSSNYRTNNFFSFLVKRSIRIDPPYYVLVLLCIAVFLYLSYISPVKSNLFFFNPFQFLAHLLYVVPFTKHEFYMHIFWTLSVEFQFYIIIGLLYFLFRNKYYQYCFLFIFSLLSFLKLPNGYYLVFSYAPIFALGISLISLYKQKTLFNWILPLLLLIIVERKFGISISILLAVCGLIILFFNSSIPFLEALGNISYSLYLTHTLAFIFIERFIIKYHIDLSIHPYFWLIFEIIISICVAYLFYILIERPSINLSKKVFFDKAKPSLTI